ncbi:MAG: Histidinol-phosphate aminotransferase, partial [uncultured Nocardioidaceae bacterium]
AAAPRGAPRHRALRRTAARRPGAAQRQREPVPAVAGGRRRRRCGRGGCREVAEPLPRPRAHRAARGARGLPRHRRRSRDRSWAGVGGQRVERGDAPPAPGLWRAGPDRTVVRADVLDVPRVRPRHGHHLGRGAPRGRLHPRHCARRRPRQGGAAERRAAALPEQPDRDRAAARHRGGALRVDAGGARDRRRRRGVRRVPAGRDAERARAPPRDPEPRRDPDDEQGLRRRRPPAGLPGREPRGLRRAARRPAALPPVRSHPGRRARGAAARRRAAGPGGGPPRGARPHGQLAPRDRAHRRRQRRELLSLRHGPGPPCGLAGPGRPRGADPGDRPRRLAPRLDRHAGGDGGVPDRAARRPGHPRERNRV